MKHILDKRLDPKVQPHEIVITFFFNDRGSGIEKTAEGLIRSAISQLLRHYPPGFRSMLGVRRKQILTNAQIVQLTSGADALRKMFLGIIKIFLSCTDQFPEDTKILFLVDALDEYAF